MEGIEDTATQQDKSNLRSGMAKVYFTDGSVNIIKFKFLLFSKKIS
jgi:hypothetical protein